MRLKNKTALITGGNSGIGLATARLFVAEGAKVAITGRNQSTLDAAEKELGSGLVALQVEMTDVAAIEKAVGAAVAKLGHLDILFANAGIARVTPVGKTSLDKFEEILKTNVTGVFFTIQAAVPHMNAGASIILNGSVVASLGNPERSAYAASKAGVAAMTRVLATELSPRGIRVNIVRIGATRTPIWSASAPSPEAMAVLENRIAKSIPLGRLAEADEVAKTILFLASDDSSYLQAAEIAVDGGATGAPAGAPIFRL